MTTPHDRLREIIEDLHEEARVAHSVVQPDPPAPRERRDRGYADGIRRALLVLRPYLAPTPPADATSGSWPAARPYTFGQPPGDAVQAMVDAVLAAADLSHGDPAESLDARVTAAVLAHLPAGQQGDERTLRWIMMEATGAHAEVDAELVAAGVRPPDVLDRVAKLNQTLGMQRATIERRQARHAALETTLDEERALYDDLGQPPEDAVQAMVDDILAAWDRQPSMTPRKRVREAYAEAIRAHWPAEQPDRAADEHSDGSVSLPHQAIVDSYRELVHLVWHALDDSEERPNEVAITKENANALGRLIPYEHPTRSNDAPPAEKFDYHARYAVLVDTLRELVNARSEQAATFINGVPQCSAWDILRQLQGIIPAHGG